MSKIKLIHSHETRFTRDVLFWIICISFDGIDGESGEDRFIWSPFRGLTKKMVLDGANFIIRGQSLPRQTHSIVDADTAVATR